MAKEISMLELLIIGSGITIFVLGVSFFVVGIFGVVYDSYYGDGPTIEKVPCYDKYGSVIDDVTCTKTVIIDSEDFFDVFLGLILIVIGWMFVSVSWRLY